MTMAMCSPASSSCNCSQRRVCSRASRLTLALINGNCSAGVSPSSERVSTPLRNCPRRPATRTMKNSSRLLAEIETKRTRSSSGCAALEASSRTRRLNSSQDNSRLMKRLGEWRRFSSESEGSAYRESTITGTLASVMNFQPPIIKANCEIVATTFDPQDKSVNDPHHFRRNRCLRRECLDGTRNNSPASARVTGRPRARPSRSNAATSRAAAAKERSMRAER